MLQLKRKSKQKKDWTERVLTSDERGSVSGIVFSPSENSVMRWCTQRRTRAVCVLLACVSVVLHFFLAALTLSIYQTPCDLHTNNIRPPAGTNLTAKGGNNAMRQMGLSQKLQRTKPFPLSPAAKPNPTKLEDLFRHPLYNQQSLPFYEDDRLLQVKPKVKDDLESSQQWMSDSEEGYDAAHWNSSSQSHPPWLRFHLGISRWQLYDHKDPNLRQLEEQLAFSRIVSAVQKTGGTQLKLLMSFPNYGQALFKPMKQERNEETNHNLYYFSDFERHNAEIAAYHLDRILGFRRIPPVVGRLIDMVKEIKDITTDRKLARTFFTSPVGNTCFYGQCSYYCSTEHAVCGRPHVLEASLAVMLPDLSLAPRRSWRSPWRRSYSRSKLAQWENNAKYCESVKKSPPYSQGTRLVDLIDMAILDFLMSNMDRHHYETFEKFGNNTFLLHLDNGRAFGRHSKDEPSILAPLVQCCRIRRSTLLKLQLLALPQYRLSDVMRASLSRDPLTSIAPLLSEQHLTALDRRLATVLKKLRRCQEQYNDSVIYNDIPGHLNFGL